MAFLVEHAEIEASLVSRIDKTVLTSRPNVSCIINVKRGTDTPPTLKLSSQTDRIHTFLDSKDRFKTAYDFLKGEIDSLVGH